MKIEYHPFTVDDLINAEIHYHELQSGLSRAFRAEVIRQWRIAGRDNGAWSTLYYPGSQYGAADYG